MKRWYKVKLSDENGKNTTFKDGAPCVGARMLTYLENIKMETKDQTNAWKLWKDWRNQVQDGFQASIKEEDGVWKIHIQRKVSGWFAELTGEEILAMQREVITRNTILNEGLVRAAAILASSAAFAPKASPLHPQNMTPSMLQKAEQQWVELGVPTPRYEFSQTFRINIITISDRIHPYGPIVVDGVEHPCDKQIEFHYISLRATRVDLT